MTIAEVRLHNFKAFERFTCTFGPSAYLVGETMQGSLPSSQPLEQRLG